jgi:predicted outer membrane lipoprotein
MIKLIIFISVALIVSAALCTAEYFVSRKSWMLGLILPAMAVLAALLFERVIFFLAAVLLIVFIVALLPGKKPDKTRGDMDKMSIQDL